MRQKVHVTVLSVAIGFMSYALVIPKAYAPPTGGRPPFSDADCFPGERFLHYSNYAGAVGISASQAMGQLSGRSRGWCVPDDGFWDYHPEPCSVREQVSIGLLGLFAIGISLVPGGVAAGAAVGLLAMGMHFQCVGREL